ncbi:MAG: helical backbone metal receptor [Rhodoferax sp.]|nr:helical backbone metal receptor [Rhodoferax sp.]
MLPAWAHRVPGARLLRRLARALAGTALVLVAGTAQAVQLTDDRGLRVNFDQPPRRIVSLLPSLTETVCAWGYCERLVGVDRDSNFPESVRSLAQVGGGLDPHIEAIVALRPDVVLLAASARSAERLQALGLKVLALEPKSHADLRRVLAQVGQLLGVPDAQKLWRDIDSGVLAAANALSESVRGTRIYFEVDSGPYAAGEASFIGETLTRLGVKNIVPANMGPFPLLNPEFVVRADPDLIMVGNAHSAGMEQRPGWSAMRAIRLQKICRFTREQGDLLVRPGPRLAQAAQTMARCLRDASGPK